MRILYFIIISLYLPIHPNLNGQQLIPYLQNKVYGFADLDGKIVINPKYEKANFFNKDGIATVKKAESWFFINRSGTEMYASSKESEPQYFFVTNKLNKKIKTTNHYDTLKHLRMVMLKNDSIKFYNFNTYKSTAIFIFDKPIFPSSSYIESPPLFNYGYYIGKIANKVYLVIDSVGNEVLKTNNKPILWSENLISYNDKDSTILFNISSKQKTKIPYATIHNYILDKYFIISNQKSDNSFAFRKSSNKKGMIDKEGKIIIDTIYENLVPFGDTILIGSNPLSVLLDLKGNPILPNQYKSIFPVNASILFAQKLNKKWVLINRKSELTNLGEFDHLDYNKIEKCFSWKNGGLVGIIDNDLNKVIDYPAESIYYGENRSYFIVQNKNKSGLIDKNKNIIIPIKYDACYMFNDEFITLILGDKRGLANIKGKIYFEPDFESIEIEIKKSNLYFRPKKNGLYACFDYNLNQLSGFSSLNSYVSEDDIHWQYDSDKNTNCFTDKYGSPLNLCSKDFYKGYVKSDSTFIVIITTNDTTVVLSGRDKSVSQISFPNCVVTNANIPSGLFGIKKDEMQGVVNHKNEAIIPLSQIKIIEINDQYILIKKDELFYLYKSNGALIVNQGFDYVDDFGSNGLRAVATNIVGKTYQYTHDPCFNGRTDTETLFYKNYGYINRKGKIVVPLKYNGTSRFFNNLAPVTKGFEDGKKSTFLIDTLGKEVLETPYDDLYPLNENAKSQYYIASLKGKKGLIDIKGKIAIPFEYNAIQGFYDSEFVQAQESSKKYHLLNKYNKRIITYENLNNNKTSENCLKIDDNKYLIFPNGQSLIINLEGDELLKFPDQDVKIIDLFGIKLIEVNGNEGKYYINCKTLVSYKKEEKTK